MIRIVDYGMGNLRSVQKAFEKLGVAAEIVTKPEQIATAKKLVLPGVGAFRDAIHELQRLELVDPIREFIQRDKPFLGICLGLQMLFDVSFEDGEWKGLGVLEGDVVRFPAMADLKVPHMGWNSLMTTKPSPLLQGIPADASFYFVHSYYVRPRDESVIAARTNYGIEFTSMVARGNLFASQFHPEKSQKVGLKLLENFSAR
ncbi:imidazole glycerol phosphate synthase subunit HisH [Schlesneria paludicola]|uniref:imidazole glycerol phosphate synthase subunit HisH n=1 Tax=Schlesneria paludicola TaxID=360056 RepID=UPI00029B2C1A|nr:imidazole glycerol phosphate synthase subunit HisH [Schlesneria paludicola]